MPHTINQSPTMTRRVTIENALPRRDVDGNIIDAHEGCMEQFGDRFYLYGTSYGNTDGYQAAGNRVVCYSSPDLMHWTAHGEILKDVPPCFLYSPDIRYNPNTGKYVLWYNWYPTYWDGKYGVATSDSPTGPFVVQNHDVKVKYPQPGDHGLLVDDDGTGYLIYNSIQNDHTISVERLAPDYLSSTLENSGVFGTNCEGASLFKRNGFYYALFDICTMMGAEGSGARVHMAASPLGPYMLTGNMNRAGGLTIIPAQQAHIVELPGVRGSEYMWMGTRWQSSPDRTKGHEFQYWGLLHFNEDGTIKPLQWKDRWQIDLRISADSPWDPPAPPVLDGDAPITLGARIRELRESAGLSVDQLAARLEGISAKYLSDVELGRRFPTECTVSDIAATLNTSAADLWAFDTRAREVTTADVREINESAQ